MNNVLLEAIEDLGKSSKEAAISFRIFFEKSSAYFTQ